MPPRTQDDPRYAPQPGRRPRRQPRYRRREDQVTNHLPSRDQSSDEDRVTHTVVAPASASPAASRARRPQPMVLPGWRHVLTLGAPDLIATVSLFLAYVVASMTGASSVMFVLPLVIPGMILGALNRSSVGQGWRAAAIVNLATMLVLFPLLVIRQSTVRVPYLDAAHGTVYAAVASTLGVLLAMLGIALFAAWASREDPESAPLQFMPAALLVPLLTSATEFARLESALPVAVFIFGIAAALTIVASMLPPAYTVFVAPIAVATEVLFVTIVRQERIFPVGVGQAGMALFASVVVAALALAVMLPAISAWLRQVEIFRLHGLRETSRA